MSEALRLADALENGECFDYGSSNVAYGWIKNDPTSDAAEELRRLHALNAELVEALQLMLDMPEYDATQATSVVRRDAKHRARAALARVEASNEP